MDLVELGGLEVRDLADRRPMVRMVRREQRAEHRHRREAVRTILVVLPPLVQDDVALVDELRLSDGGQEKAHSVGLHPQRELERAVWHDLPVVRPIRIRRAVERRARALQRLEVATVVVLRALEHQMLEQMREPGAAWLFVLRSHVIPQVDGDDGARVIFVQEHIEAVVERVLREREVHFLKLPQVGISVP